MFLSGVLLSPALAPFSGGVLLLSDPFLSAVLPAGFCRNLSGGGTGDVGATVTPLMVTLVGGPISSVGTLGLPGGATGGGAGGLAVCGRGVMVASRGPEGITLLLA